MAFPVKSKTWTISYNNAITGASLNAMMGNYLFAVSQFYLAHGYTCKGSCDGVTGAMDGVNRWASAANCITRGATTANANSWMVLVDANGCNILMSYVGATDDIAIIAYSRAGLYVAAGTPANTPTATDELVLASATTVINNTAAATQRNLFMWVDSASQMMRVLLTLQTTDNPCGITWGVEVFDATLQDKTISPSVWGFAYSGSGGFFGVGSGTSAGFMGAYSQVAGNYQGGRIRVNGSAVNINGGIIYSAGAGAFSLPWCNLTPELQGGVGYPIWGPLRLGSSTSGFTGMVAQLFDWWTCRYNNLTTSNAGDTYDNKNFMAVGIGGGLLWPGDGSTTPVTGAIASVAQPGEHTGFQNLDEPAYGSFLNGASMYVPLAVNVITPTGPEAVKSVNRRAGTDLIRLIPRTDDPAPEAGRTLLYARTIGGLPALFAMYENGDVYEVGSDAE